MIGLLLVAGFASLTVWLHRAACRARALDAAVARHPAGKARR